MSKSKMYFVQYRSTETCLAMELTEDTELPVEFPSMGDQPELAVFKTGGFEIRQSGRVFGRGKAVHEGRFKRVVGAKGGSDE